MHVVVALSLQSEWKKEICLNTKEWKNASAGNRTRIYCLEGNNANLYTTDAWWIIKIIFCYYINILNSCNVQITLKYLVCVVWGGGGCSTWPLLDFSHRAFCGWISFFVPGCRTFSHSFVKPWPPVDGGIYVFRAITILQYTTNSNSIPSRWSLPLFSQGYFKHDARPSFQLSKENILRMSFYFTYAVEFWPRAWQRFNS